MVMTVIRPLLPWDLHLSYSIEDWRRVSGPSMRVWLNAVGELEAISSIAGYDCEHRTPYIAEPSLDHASDAMRMQPGTSMRHTGERD
jgi:hypothetical protein